MTLNDRNSVSILTLKEEKAMSEDKPMTIDDMECHLSVLDTHIEDLVSTRDCFKRKLKLSKPHIPLPGIDFDPPMISTNPEEKSDSWKQTRGILKPYIGEKEKMEDKPRTVGDLKEFIKDLPDEMLVLVHHNIPYTNDDSEMLPLGDLYVAKEKNGKVLEIYPNDNDCY